MKDPAVIAAYIAAGAAFLGSVVTGVLTWHTLKKESAREIGKLALDFRMRQLNDLYGPLLLLTKQQACLADKLREGVAKPEEWHLLDNLQVLNEPNKKAIVDAIMDISARIEKILTTCSGLVTGEDPPHSFAQFLSHFNTLVVALRTGKRLQVVEYFPKQFDRDIEQGFRDVKRGLDKALTRHEKELMS